MVVLLIRVFAATQFSVLSAGYVNEWINSKKKSEGINRRSLTRVILTQMSHLYF